MFRALRLATRVLPITAKFYSTKLVPPPDPRSAHRVPPPCSSRLPPPCALPPYAGPAVKPCFDINAVMVERTNQIYAPMMKSFLYTHYFTREPSLVALYVPLDSYYLTYLTNHFLYECSGWLAFEIDPRSGEKTLIGMILGSNKYPWEANKFEKWGDRCNDPERIHMYFHAHCFRHPDIFRKYKVPFVYNIDMVATASDYIGMGVATLLLQTAILYAVEMKVPLMQFIVTNSYMNGPCKRNNMKKAWTMKYMEYVDIKGHSVFRARPPHTAVNIYVRPPHPTDRGGPDQTWSPDIYKLFTKKGQENGYSEKPGILPAYYPPLPKCPTL